MPLTILPLSPDTLPDFYRLHGDELQGLGCYCVPMHVTDWNDWATWSAGQNRTFREELCARGVFEGYLCYEDGEPVGWCQAGPRDSFRKLIHDFGFTDDPGAWAVTCYYIRDGWTGKGIASHFLDHVMEQARDNGASSLYAFPRKEQDTSAHELWNGPLGMYQKRGFEVVGETEARFAVRLGL